MKALVDPKWAEAAKDNARKGYGHAVWVKVGESPAILYDSYREAGAANGSAERLRDSLRARKTDAVVIVTDERA